MALLVGGTVGATSAWAAGGEQPPVEQVVPGTEAVPAEEAVLPGEEGELIDAGVVDTAPPVNPTTFPGALPPAGTGTASTLEYTEPSGAPAGHPAASAATVRTAWCKGTADVPHWSRGGGSVIYKTRIECIGNIPSVQVKVDGTLVHIAGGGPNIAATSSQTQTISTLNGKKTYYTPVPSGRKVRYSGKFQGSSAFKIVSPRQGSTGTAGSQIRQVNVP